jgi:hypothetical protein
VFAYAPSTTSPVSSTAGPIPLPNREINSAGAIVPDETLFAEFATVYRADWSGGTDTRNESDVPSTAMLLAVPAIP